MSTDGFPGVQNRRPARAASCDEPTWATRDQLRCALFDYVECFYNPDLAPKILDP